MEEIKYIVIKPDEKNVDLEEAYLIELVKEGFLEINIINRLGKN